MTAWTPDPEPWKEPDEAERDRLVELDAESRSDGGLFGGRQRAADPVRAWVAEQMSWRVG